jgi:hypothetical protein
MTRPPHRAAGAPDHAAHANSAQENQGPQRQRPAPEPPAQHQAERGQQHSASQAAQAIQGDQPANPRRHQVATRRLIWVAILLLTTAVSITVALRITPLQTVTVAGQVIKVGATAPTPSISGPGEVDLFGQSLDTYQHFFGPVRPRLQLTQITINSQLTNFVQGSKPGGAERVLGNVLASGWIHYFAWETVLTGLGALVLLGALAGFRRLPHRTTVKLLAAGLVVTEAVNLGAIMLTAYSAPAALRQVHSLNQLVGNAPPVHDLTRVARVPPGVQVVVMGDSTAAGAGLPAVPDPSRVDVECGRSADSYAGDLARANGWKVLNLACNSATISNGLLGPEGRGGDMVPAQIDAAQGAKSARVVIVSVGADDLGWSSMLRLCAAAPRCDDRATTAYFQQQLAKFSKDYLQLLNDLATLPSHPQVIINRYYDPFNLQLDCLSRYGLTTPKLSTLNSRLATLNAVLQKGATDFGFSSVQPDFTGHELCTPQPYVQGMSNPAPFHPTALGQLAMALADQAAIHG